MNQRCYLLPWNFITNLPTKTFLHGKACWIQTADLTEENYLQMIESALKYGTY